MFESLLLFTCCMTTPITSNQEDVYFNRCKNTEKSVVQDTL